MRTELLEKKITEYILNTTDINMDVLLDLRNQIRSTKTVVLRNFKTGEIVIPENDVVRIEAQKAYSIFHLANGKQIVSSRNLNYHAKMLDQNMFMRMHRSHLINIFHVEKIISVHERKLMMKGDVILDYSRRKASEVKKKLHHLFM